MSDCAPLLELGPWLPWQLPPFPVLPAPHLMGQLQARVIWPGPPLPLWEFGQLRVPPLLCPHPWPLSQGLLGAITLSSMDQCCHELGNLLPQFCCPFPQVSCYHDPCPHLILDFLILTLCLLGGNHQLWVGGTGGAIQVLDGVTNVFMEPRKWQSLRCCWASRSIILLGHCDWIWLRVPSSLMLKEGTFSLLPHVTL